MLPQCPPHGCMRPINVRLLLLFPAILPAEKKVDIAPTLCSLRSNMSEQSGIERPRSVVKKVLARQQREGEGAVVRRSIGRSVFLF